MTAKINATIQRFPAMLVIAAIAVLGSASGLTAAFTSWAVNKLLDHDQAIVRIEVEAEQASVDRARLAHEVVLLRKSSERLADVAARLEERTRNRD